MIAEFSVFFSYFLFEEGVYFGFICYFLITCVEPVTQCSNFNIIILLILNAMKLILLHEYKWNIVLSFVIVCQQLLFFIYYIIIIILMQPIYFICFSQDKIVRYTACCFIRAILQGKIAVDTAPVEHLEENSLEYQVIRR